MKINGSLIFDASSASEIQNLRLQKVTGLPAITAGDVGRLVYNTTTNVIHVGTNVNNALSWVPLATGGDAAGLLAEVDRVETALGLNGDGSFNAGAFTGNLAGQTDYVGLITTLQGLIAAAQSAAQTAATNATNASAALRTDLDAEVTRATAAEGAEVTRATGEEVRIEGLITSEVTRATGIEGGLRTDLDVATAAVAAEVTRATAAEGANTTAIQGEVTRATAAEAALGGRVDGVTTAAAAETDRVNAAIAAEAARAGGVETALDGRITTEVADRTAAVDGVAADLASEVTRAGDAETALGARIDTEVTDRSTAISNLRTEVTSALVGLTWEAPVDLIAGVVGDVDLTGLADGYRIVDLATNAIFTVAGGALGAPEPLVDGAAFFNRTNDTGYVFNGTTVVPFNGASSITAGNGLVTIGNRVDVASASGTLTITEDSVDVAQSVLDSIDANADAVAAEADRATTAETGLGQRITDETTARNDAIAGEVAARDAAIAVETGRATAAETALGGRVDGEVTRATAREDQIAADLVAEVTARTTATDAATAAIGAETTRATGVEGGLRTDLNAATAAVAAETTRATGIEGGLRTDLDAETGRATDAETAIGARIDSMYFLYASTGPAVSHAVAHNLGQQYCNVTVVDMSDNVVIPESIVFDSANALTVTFNSAIDCRVVVMGLAAPAA